MDDPTITTVAAGTLVTTINVPLDSVSKDQTVTVRYTVDVDSEAPVTADTVGIFTLQTDRCDGN